MIATSHDNPDEIFPIVDEEDHVVGRATRGECHSGSMLLHPVVHLHIFSPTGELFLQKRPDWKDIQPGRWDTAVGGHQDWGETTEQALSREVSEEVGLTDFEPRFLMRYVFSSTRERELVNVFSTVTDRPLAPSAETAGGRFFTLSEIESLMGTGFFTPNFEGEYRRLKDAGCIDRLSPRR